MTTALTILESAHAIARAAFESTDDETAAIALATRQSGGGRLGLLIDRFELVPSQGYRERTPGNFSLEPRYVAEAALRAAAAGRTLIVAHTHPGALHPSGFSPVDDRMNRALMPSLLRTLEPPVGAVVYAHGNWRGSLWSEGGRELPIDVVRIAGGRLVLQSRRDRRVDQAAFERQIRAFGGATQFVLASLRVGIIGLGGTGSIAAAWLARLGVKDFVLVDADRVEVSNLSRVQGSTPADAREGMLKVAVAERTIRAIRPDAEVAAVARDARECDVLQVLTSCDVLFACTDSHSSRAALNQLPFQYGIPLIDVATLLRGREGAVTGAFADVRLVHPGGACLRCQRAIDAETAAFEAMGNEERAVHRRFGYGPDVNQPDPSVLPLNGLGVSLAVLRLFDLVEPWLTWPDRITLDARSLQVVEQDLPPQADCDICGPDVAPLRGDSYPLICRRSVTG